MSVESLRSIELGDVPLVDWGISLAIVVGAIVAGRLLHVVIGRYARRSLGESRWGDLLVRPTQGPVVFLITLLGLWSGLQRLDLDPELGAWLQRVLSFLVVLPVTWGLGRFADALVENFVVPYFVAESDVDDHLLPVVRRLIVIGVWCVGLLIAVDNAGYDVTAVLAGLGIGGLAFALAGQDTLSNFFGGVAIFADQPFRVGDRVQLRGSDRRDIDGVVESIGLRSTRIRSRYEGRMIAIPNSVVANRNVVNVDSEAGRQMFQVYRLAPDTSADDVEKALQILAEAVRRCDGTQEKVITGFISANEISRDVMLLYWISPEASKLGVRSEINLHLVRRFEEAGIRFTDRARYHHEKTSEL